MNGFYEYVKMAVVSLSELLLLLQLFPLVREQRTR